MDTKIETNSKVISNYLKGGFIGTKFLVSTAEDLVQLFTLSSEIKKLEKYTGFLQTIVNDKYVSLEMRGAAQSLLDDIEHGYSRKIKEIFDNCCTLVIESSETFFEVSSLSSAGGTVLFGAFIINIAVDVGEFVRDAAYSMGYGELSMLYSYKLQEDKLLFQQSPSAANAWKFYEDYNLLWRLRECGEKAYLSMYDLRFFLFGRFKVNGYRVNKEMVDQTLERLEEARFEIFDEITIPESVQYVKKSIMNCPIDVDIFTSDGVYITTLKDGAECDITNCYGRFAVVYEPYDGEYTKVICQSTCDDLIIKAKAVDNGIVDFQSASENNTSIWSFDKVIVEKNDVIEIGASENLLEYSVDRSGDGVIDETSQLISKEIDAFVPVEELNISENSVELKMGATYTVDISVVPAESTFSYVTWYSSDEDVATVKNGVITAVAPGAATIYAKADDAVDISASISVTVLDEINAALVGTNLTLDGSIGVNFFMELGDDIVNNKRTYMHFELPNGTNSNVSINNAVIDTKTIEGKTLYVFKCKVAPKEMAELIMAQLIVPQPENEEELTETSDIKNLENSSDFNVLKGRIYRYTVKQYAKSVLENKDNCEEYERVHDLIEAMLNYGVYAQEYFKFNTYNPSTNNRLDMSHITAESLEEYAHTEEQGNDNVRFAGVNMELISETTLRMYFSIKNVDIKDVTFIYQNNLLDVERVGEYYCVSLTGITANNLDSDCVVMVNDGKDEFSVSYSPLAYCYSAISRKITPIQTEALKDLLRAFVIYNEEANKYFE